jgi:hypothetical protein
MAKQVMTTTEYTDDLDGSKAAGTVAFSYDGVEYEIDLSKTNTKAFASAVAPYVSAARPVKAVRKRAPRKSAKLDLAVVREWAAANEHAVSTRGRIPSAVLEAYEAAH